MRISTAIVYQSHPAPRTQALSSQQSTGRQQGSSDGIVFLFLLFQDRTGLDLSVSESHPVPDLR